MNTWTYIQSEFSSRDGNDLFTVGFYDDNGKWRPESDHDTATEAAKRVNYLNGSHQLSESKNLASLDLKSEYLINALTRISNCNDIATAREYAREAIEKQKNL